MVNANVISGQSELSSAGVDITNDDLLIHDNDAGALKKVSVTNLISSAGGLTEVVADTTPQLGGDLDVNGNGIVSTSNGNIALTPNGTGVVRIDGNVDIQSGTIDLKNSGSRSKINFYCESGNAHAQALQAAPHSESASNTLTLPSTGGDVDLVSTASTATLTNKSIDSDNNTITNIVNADIKSSAAIADTKLATISTAGKVALSALEIDGASDIGANLADADLLIVDDGAGGTNRKTAMSRVATYIEGGISGDISISSGTAAIGSGVIVNDDVNASAALEFSKMENLTASRALVSDSNGDVSAATTTSTEIGYVNGVTSAIQTQLDAKASKGFATAMAIAL
jgi:hypothetical protein